MVNSIQKTDSFIFSCKSTTYQWSSTIRINSPRMEILRAGVVGVKVLNQWNSESIRGLYNINKVDSIASGWEGISTMPRGRLEEGWEEASSGIGECNILIWFFFHLQKCGHFLTCDFVIPFFFHWQKLTSDGKNWHRLTVMGRMWGNKHIALDGNINCLWKSNLTVSLKVWRKIHLAQQFYS